MTDTQTEDLINRAVSRAMGAVTAELLAAIERAGRPTESVVDRLPPGLGSNRILNASDTCEFLGFSLAHWRRLRAAREAPEPIKIGARINGWRISTLIDWQDSRTKKAPVDEPRRDPRHVLTSEPARA
jgi:predicted DNA-binding transcriptional regulator AlpA